MKILQVNKFHYPRGGADAYFLSLANIQRSSGHEVAVFSMHHPENLPSPWSKYFISRVSFNRQSISDLLLTTGRVIYSLEAKRNFSRLLDDFQPDIIHCHNIYHHISPSILDAAAQRKIPVVMHLHDYNLVAANHALYASGGHICDPANYWACLKRRCIKDSLPATVLGLVTNWLHHDILKIYERGLSALIAPSVYMANTVSKYRPNLPTPKVIYNAFDSNLAKHYVADKKSSDYLLYFGRLSEEKGLDILIKAAALSGQLIKIAGTGPEEKKLLQLILELKAPVELMGYQSGKNLAELIIHSKAVVVPSVWHENMPLSLLEAMSLGKAIIASRVGGLPEMVKEGVNGFLFEPGSSDDLVEKIKLLNQTDLNSLSEASLKLVEGLSPQGNYEKIISLYQEILNKKTPA